MLRVFAMVAVAALAICACGEGDTHPGPNSSSESAVEALDGVVFESESMVEMGLGPNGVIQGHAKLAFHDGSYDWRHSDLDCHGTYTYSDGNVEAATKIPCATYGTIRGRFDPEGGILTWASGVRYVRK